MSSALFDNNAGRLSLKADGKLHFLAIESIHCIKSSGNYVEFIIGPNAQRLLVRETLTAVEKALNSSHFVRIHRSVIVNARLIAEMKRMYTGEYRLTLCTGEILTLSRSYKHNLLRFLQSYSGSRSSHIPRLARLITGSSAA